MEQGTSTKSKFVTPPRDLLGRLTWFFLENFFSETLELTRLPPYLPTFYDAFLAFLLVHRVVAPVISAQWFPVAFEKKGRVAKNNRHVLILPDISWYNVAHAFCW